jgi:hypothetical protein
VAAAAAAAAAAAEEEDEEDEEEKTLKENKMRYDTAGCFEIRGRAAGGGV